MKRLLLLAALLAPIAALSAQDPSGIDEKVKGEYVHRESGTMFRPTPGWLTVTPQRLRRFAATTVMGLERAGDLRIITNVTYTPLEGRKYAELITATADKNGDFGEEHAMLNAIYGKERVGKPETTRVGSFSITKIRIAPGPIPEDQQVGLVYLFEAGTGEKRWKVKVRSNFPSNSEPMYAEMLDKLVQGFGVEAK